MFRNSVEIIFSFLFCNGFNNIIITINKIWTNEICSQTTMAERSSEHSHRTIVKELGINKLSFVIKFVIDTKRQNQLKFG